MAQDLGSIMQSLDAGYNPQRQLINDQIGQLPSQAASQTAGLQAQQNTAFDSITRGAQDRGMGFSGIPLQEQARYTSDNYLPAVAKVQESQNNAKTSLTDALNNVNQQQRTQAYGMQNDQLNREQQQAQFDASQAAAERARAASRADNAGFDFGSLLGDQTAATPDSTAGAATGHAVATQRGDGGFNYNDPNGRGINAAEYAKLTGQNIRDVLSQSAQHGDKGSIAALKFIGNDGKADPTKINSPQLASLYKALTGQNIGVYRPGASVHNQIVAGVKSLPGRITIPGVRPAAANSSMQQRLDAARKAGRVK